jgi:hypothetical protein
MAKKNVNKKNNSLLNATTGHHDFPGLMSLANFNKHAPLQHLNDSHSTVHEHSTDIQFDFKNVPVQNLHVQTKLMVSHPLDPYEQEADRIADEVLQNNLSYDVEEEEDESTGRILTTPLANAITPLAQRQYQELEEEDDEEMEIQTKLSTPKDKNSNDFVNLEGRLRAGRAGGTTLEPSVRKKMQRSFGADFSKVRVHTNSEADNLSRSFGAIAFTSGKDIFFRLGAYDPLAESGRRLLVHELTHVVQQNPELKLDISTQSRYSNHISRSAKFRSVHDNDNVIQRQGTHHGKKNKPATRTRRRNQGSIFYFDKNGEEVKNQDKSEISDFELVGGSLPPPGVYELEFFEDGPNLMAKIQGEVFLLKVIKEGKNFRQKLSQGLTAILSVADPDAEESIEPEQEKAKRRPSTKGQGVEEGGKSEKAGKGKEEEGEGDSESGNEFGGLGLGNAPEWLKKALAKALKLLGDDEDVKALFRLIRAIRDFGSNIDEFKSLFSNPDKLLGVVLGIEESTALDLLENWVNKPEPKHRRKGGKHKGIVALVVKVLNLLVKVRKILKPLFKARAIARAAVGSVLNFITQMEAFEELFENRKNLLGTNGMDALLERFSTQIAGNLQAKFDSLRVSFKLMRESFVESDFVTVEEIARALTAVLRKIMGPHARAGLYIAEKLGLDLEDKISGVIAKIIPKSLVDIINDNLRTVTKALDEKFGNTIETNLNSILVELEFQLQQRLIPEIKNALLSLSSKNSSSPQRVAIIQALREMSKSQGEPLPSSLKQSAERTLGFNFSKVRIYHDSSAARASEAIGANAFTIGSRIYFGPEQFKPASALGYRLIAHELTHVVQQNRGSHSSLIFRDYKTTLENLVKKFGSAVTNSIINIGKPSKDMKDKADTILKYLEKFVIGKRVTSSRVPKLPAEAYVYERNKNGKIIRIRRIRKWLGLLPALHINRKTGEIGRGFGSLFDPNKKDREQLRRALGCCRSKDPKRNEQAHHIIPLEYRNNTVVQLAIKNGFNFNSARNGICLSEFTHYGSHPQYNEFLRQELVILRTQNPSLVWSRVFESQFYTILDEIKHKIRKLNRAGRNIDEIKR